MRMTISIRESNLPNLVYRGKVRDTHDLGDGLLLMVATDRISAFDVVLPTSIPEKGAVLCQLSLYWFNKTSHLVPNHLVAMPLERSDLSLPTEISRRSMIVRKAERVNVECIARGYITGSAWDEYREKGTVSGLHVPSGMKEGDKFPDPLFTPTTKSEVGHDEMMSLEELRNIVGSDTAKKLLETTIGVYQFAHEIALKKGIIIADTKMEFGFIDGRLSIIDELLTPDSSRFWDASGYSPGVSLPNFDKQFVRDLLKSYGWDRKPPAPELPENIVEKTRDRYIEALQRLTGCSLN